jgi:hypothetical protein
MKKLIALAAVVTALLLLAACNSTGGDSDTQEQVNVKLALTEGGAPKYIVVRSDIADKTETDAAVRLRKALSEAYGVDFTLTNDWVKPGVQEEVQYEILVGATGRDASVSALETLGEGSFVIKADGDKIVILGNTPLGTSAAVDYFISHYITGDGEDMKPVANLLYNGTYKEPGTIYVIANGMADKTGFWETDVVRLFSTLQGLLNRRYSEGETNFLLFQDFDDSDQFWLSYMMGEGKTFEGFQTVTLSTAEELWDFIKPYIKEYGIILWDPNVPSTSNVASTICGLDGYLPVKFDESQGSLYNFLLSNGVEVKQSLVGMFTGKEGTKIADTDIDSTGSAKCDAYLWALDKYMDRCSKTHIAYTLDGAGTIPSNPIYQRAEGTDSRYNQIPSHDYYVYHRMFFFDLTPTKQERPCDDPDQPRNTDRNTLEKILQTMYDRSGGKMVQLLGFPPWWMKYTTFRGNGKVEPVTLEWSFTQFITTYNCVKEADAAHPAWMSNASVYTQYKLTRETYENNRPAEKLTFDKDTIYYTIYMGDYDSSAWLKKHVANFWRDSARGTLPLNWGFNPNLSDRVPMVWEYVMENASPNDYIISGDSGAGYVFPSALFDAKLRTLPDAKDTWVAYNEPYFKKFDLDIVGFIINGVNPVTEEVMEMYNKIAPGGSMHNDGSKRLTIYKGVPYLYLQNGIDPTGADTPKIMYDFMRSNFSSKINFAAFRTVCNSPTQIAQCVQAFQKYAESKDSRHDYVYVDIYTLFDLIKQSGQGKIID